MARISGVNIPTNKKVHIALTYIFGIGNKIATDICGDASIDLSQDTVLDWQFMSSPAYGSFGWQTRLDDTSTKHSMSVDGNGTLSVLVPQNANVHTLLLGINPDGLTNPLTVSSGQNSFYQITAYNWTTSVVSISK